MKEKSRPVEGEAGKGWMVKRVGQNKGSSRDGRPTELSRRRAGWKIMEAIEMEINVQLLIYEMS